MADQERKRRGWLRPRLPRIRRSEIRATEEFANLRSALRELRHACPHDGAQMGLVDVFPTDPATGDIQPGAEPVRSLVCPECNFSLPVTTIIEEQRVAAAPLKAAERQFTLYGVAILLLFGLIFLFNHNLLTIAGALVLSLTLFIKAMFYRYRHWQASTGEMFLDRPPVASWLRAEFQRGK